MKPKDKLLSLLTENDDSITIAKGFGIILMVLGHSGFYDYGNAVIHCTAFLRKQMPFRIRPAQIKGSRLAGYLAWYGGYLFPYEWWYSRICQWFG